jgi:DNA-binding GntR family transcriptional regulator
VSRTPVRESLQRLATEGFVTIHRRAWVAREHTPEEVGEIYEFRMALEGFAARLAATRAPVEDLDRLANLHHAATARISSGALSRLALVDVNEEFHDTLALVSGNQRLFHQLKQNRQYYFNHRIASLYTEEEAAAQLEGHGKILDAVLAKDGDRADREARTHIVQALAIILSKIR